jgi:hypothetical protein
MLDCLPDFAPKNQAEPRMQEKERHWSMKYVNRLISKVIFLVAEVRYRQIPQPEYETFPLGSVLV